LSRVYKSLHYIALIVSLTYEEATQSNTGKYQSTDISIVILMINMLKRLPGSPAGRAATISNELPTLVYNRDSGRMPSNITAILELWREKLTSTYGSVANFIGTGKYHEKTPPVAPVLSSLDPEGFEYDVKISTYKTAYKTWYTRQQDDIDIRVNIYSKRGQRAQRKRGLS
jgi:hypothetical protein